MRWCWLVSAWMVLPWLLRTEAFSTLPRRRAQSYLESYVRESGSGSLHGEGHEPRPPHVRDWTAQQVGSWLLTAAGLNADVVSNFLRDGIDGQELMMMGTPDEYDHITWRLELLGVADSQEQDRVGVLINELATS